MAAEWERWLRHAKAKLDDAVRRGEAELDRLEAEQRARAEGRPWLDADGAAPTFAEARARIEHEAGTPRPEPEGPQPDTGTDPVAVDFSAQQRAAAERVAAMRRELGLDDADGPGAPPRSR